MGHTNSDRQEKNEVSVGSSGGRNGPSEVTVVERLAADVASTLCESSNVPYPVTLEDYTNGVTLFFLRCGSCMGWKNTLRLMEQFFAHTFGAVRDRVLQGMVDPLEVK